jgi:hypothetical protein
MDTYIVAPQVRMKRLSLWKYTGKNGIISIMGKADYGFAATMIFCLAYMMADSMDSRSNSPEREPTGAPVEQEWSDITDQNTLVLTGEDTRGLWGVADQCTATEPELILVWNALVAQYGEDYVTRVGQAVDVPSIKGATVDCAANSQ